MKHTPKKPDVRATGCEGKVQFRSFDEAERSLRAAMRHKGAADTKMGVYRCRYCAHFHIGHARGFTPAAYQKKQELKRA